MFEGFADSNYICFPYETRAARASMPRAACDQPMTHGHCPRRRRLRRRALKAVQCIESAEPGAFPCIRALETFPFPVFNFVRCTQCKRCTEECPFGALDDDRKGQRRCPIPTRCRRCGTCMGACPERVISFRHLRAVGMICSEMIKQVEYHRARRHC